MGDAGACSNTAEGECSGTSLLEDAEIDLRDFHSSHHPRRVAVLDDDEDEDDDDIPLENAKEPGMEEGTETPREPKDDSPDEDYAPLSEMVSPPLQPSHEEGRESVHLRPGRSRIIREDDHVNYYQTQRLRRDRLKRKHKYICEKCTYVGCSLECDCFVREDFPEGKGVESRCAKRIKLDDFVASLEKLKKHRMSLVKKEAVSHDMKNWLAQFQKWPHAEKLVAMDNLFSVCEPNEVKHMMEMIEPQFQRDFITLLPKEVSLHILSFLSAKDLLRAAQTNKCWRVLADDNLLWKEKCREEKIDANQVVNSNYAANRPYLMDRPYLSGYKFAYMRKRNIEKNWRQNRTKATKTFKGHDNHVITCLQFYGNRIVSGSDDNTLKVWSVTTGKCLKTLFGHTGGVWSSQMTGSVIVSGSTDRTLKVWNAETGDCVYTLYGHTSTVRCMHLHKYIVVSGSRDATLRVWDIEKGQCLHTLIGHMAAVRCVQYDGRLVVSGAYDYTVKVWDPNTEVCLHTLTGHTNRVYSLQFDGVHVVSGSLDTSIKVWDVETGQLKHTLVGHQSLTSGMELKNNILVSGNADSTVKVWDIITGRCLQTLSGCNKHQSAVTCLQFNSAFVLTSSDDGTVKLWDVKTGEFIRDMVTLDSGGSGGVVWRIRADETRLVCAVGSRNNTEETKLIVLDFDVEPPPERPISL